ncbi:lysophospholipid acyltransferase family protein [Oceanidesulfovibrio marinus]|uniref:Glycerol acyltransferase n=1 Tax=Oceanidesulfovibrio marinus TaxID=370038 RepID=A0A6P1ZPR8_9BACT|nr:GNAT family N-acyltransferase [Oceanidesulfovibrio marinus]TVM36507.1 glycerol acyltransferase [Oceanidesulfovibrio marinus]
MAHEDIFTLDLAKEKSALHKVLLSAFGRPLERLIGLDKLNEIHRNSAALKPDEEFMSRVLESMGAAYTVPDSDMLRIPKKGPVVVVANHPFGAIEGVILGAMLKRAREDVKIMGNYLLGLIPELQDMIITVDNFGSADSLKKNIRPLKESIRWLRGDHVLAIFPSGEVSHLDLHKRRIMDPAWNRTVGRIIHRTEAPVLPVFFPGANSPIFHVAGLINPRLRTALLPRQFIKRKGGTFPVRIGNLIPYKKIERLDRDEELMAYLRLRTYMLKRRVEEDGATARRLKLRLPLLKRGAGKSGKKKTEPRSLEPVVEGKDPKLLIAEMESLPPDNLLVEMNTFRVYKAKAQAIPNILEEIGRLREHTFRQVGEGTGKGIDLDRYDEYYDHLFVWEAEKQELVGAYRIGRTDRIVPKHGIEGLYTSSLFSFKQALFDHMGPGLEMGRSFVRPEYQRSFAPLLLLWKGIAQYVLLSPDYKVLFGPVSISSDYSPISREMIVRYMRENNWISELSKMVKPKMPPKFRKMRRHEIREFRNIFTSEDDVSGVITDIEPVVKGIPVLLKQYLKLGGKILAFNVDPDFNNCLDGLIYVDLTQASPKVLSNYMGKDNYINFIEYHMTKSGELEQ